MPSGHIHTGDPPYAPPLLRAASPSSSIGTDYGPDTTSTQDAQMSPDQFSTGLDQRLLLNMPRQEEIDANQEPLLPKPKNPRDNKLLHDKVMANLREAVKKLEEDEVFERTVLRSSQLTNGEQPSSNDIDAILQSMMNPPSQPASPQKSAAKLINPLILPETNGHGQLFGGGVTTEGESESQSSSTAPGRRPPRSKGKPRRG